MTDILKERENNRRAALELLVDFPTEELLLMRSMWLLLASTDDETRTRLLNELQPMHLKLIFAMAITGLQDVLCTKKIQETTRAN